MIFPTKYLPSGYFNKVLGDGASCIFFVFHPRRVMIIPNNGDFSDALEFSADCGLSETKPYSGRAAMFVMTQC